MKRTKPVATPSPSTSLQPEIKDTSVSQEIDQARGPAPGVPEAGQQARPPAAVKPLQAESMPLGLATAEPGPGRVSAPAPEKRMAVPKLKQPIERSSIPTILLEGDEAKPLTEAGPAQKFATPARPETGHAETQPPPLPESYGSGRLLLTARDPDCLYAHWDLSSEQQQQHRTLSAQNELRLRIYQDSLSGPVVREVTIATHAHHSFVPVDAPAAKGFAAELGYYPAGGSWKAVASAHTAAAAFTRGPAAEPVRFATLSFCEPESPAQPMPVQASSQVARRGGVAAAASEEALSFPLPEPLAGPKGAVLSSGAAEIVPPEEPQSCGELWVDPESQAAIGDLLPEEGEQAPECHVAPWTDAQERALAELIGRSVIRGGAPDSAGIAELVRSMGRVAAAGELSSVALAGPELDLSSVGLSGRPAAQPQAFWLNVNAELVVYGATQPGATVTLGGRPIALRPDGTFSYRFALPDGSYELPVTAHSVRGEPRSATLNFHRDTAYSQGTGPHPQSPELKPPGVEHVA